MRLTNMELASLRVALGMFIANIKSDGPTKKLYVSLYHKVLAECAKRERPWRHRWGNAIGLIIVLALLGVFAAILRSVQ